MNINQLYKNAYAPYSDFKKDWCVVKGSSGTFYPGVRVENISFPLTISPLHGAICSCLGNGDQPVSFFADTASSELVKYWVDQFQLSELTVMPEKIDLYTPFHTELEKGDTMLEDLISSAVTIHSDFPVSALLYTEYGVVPGVNVEVDSWALGLCAERLAIFRAVSAGAKSFHKLSVKAPKGDFSSPCGACRQVLMEWMPDKVIELHHGDHTQSTHRIVDLLPHAFSSSKLT